MTYDSWIRKKSHSTWTFKADTLTAQQLLRPLENNARDNATVCLHNRRTLVRAAADDEQRRRTSFGASSRRASDDDEASQLPENVRIAFDADWREVGSASLSVDVCRQLRFKTWREDAEAQRNYLMTNDIENRSIFFLWDQGYFPSSSSSPAPKPSGTLQPPHAGWTSPLPASTMWCVWATARFFFFSY